MSRRRARSLALLAVIAVVGLLVLGPRFVARQAIGAGIRHSVHSVLR
jgi:Sec-independent protein translocase protein TatA